VAEENKKYNKFKRFKNGAKRAGILALLVAILASGKASSSQVPRNFYVLKADNGIVNVSSRYLNNAPSAKLVSVEHAIASAQKDGVLNLISKDENRYVRFNAKSGVPIRVVCDMQTLDMGNIPEVVSSCVEKFNDIFNVINPEIQFEYTEFKDWDQNQNLPYILLLGRPSLHYGEGAIGLAVTTPLEDKNSKDLEFYNVSKAFIEISQIGTIRLPASAKETMILHEMAHALGCGHNKEDKTSIMTPYATNQYYSSTAFSADTLKTLKALYYNPETNKNNETVVEDYLLTESAKRMGDLQTYADLVELDKKDKLEAEKLQIESQTQNAILSYNKYCNTHYNSSLIEGKNAEGKIFVNVNSFGLKETLSFDQGNYTLTIYDKNGQGHILSGKCEYNGERIILNGEYYYINVKDNQITKTKEKILCGIDKDYNLLLGVGSRGFCTEKVFSGEGSVNSLSK